MLVALRIHVAIMGTKKQMKTLLALLALFPFSACAAPEELPSAVAVNTIWVMTASALIFLMQAGFAFLEGGMVRSKNTVNVIMKNFMDSCYSGIVFWIIGFGVMFGYNPSGWFGVDHFLPTGLSDWDNSCLLFQMMFVAVSTTIASGAMAERTSYPSYLIGACGISGIIYPVFGSWAWGGMFGTTGWLKSMGFIDFAGSSVVHSVGGWCALAGIIVVGPRLGRFGAKGEVRDIPGHNLTLVALGAFILWFGWFGFNGGSTLQANASIGKILLNTHLSGCAGAVGTATLMFLLRKPVSLTGVLNGALGGLVGITAGCATMDPQFALLTGFVAGMLLQIGSATMLRLRLDDAVDAVSVHGLCGVWGTLAAGLFLSGNLFNPKIVSVQLFGIAAAFIWAFSAALVMYWFIRIIFGLRSDPIHEQRGLDFTEHAELGYPEFQNVHTQNRDDLNR